MSLLPDFVAPLPQHIDEFKELYRERFGILLGDEQARQHLEHLLVVVSYRSGSYRQQQLPPADFPDDAIQSSRSDTNLNPNLDPNPNLNPTSCVT